MTDYSPHIYVACLASYNNGILHGAWIDANQDTDALYTEIKNNILDTSPIQEAEEWAIHDYEDFGSITISEYEGLKEVSQYASLISEHGELGAQLLDYYGDIDEVKTAIEERYHGCYSSMAEYAETFIDDCYEIPAHLEYYYSGN